MEIKGKTVFITGSTDGVGRYIASTVRQPCHIDVTSTMSESPRKVISTAT